MIIDGSLARRIRPPAILHRGASGRGVCLPRHQLRAGDHPVRVFVTGQRHAAAARLISGASGPGHRGKPAPGALVRVVFLAPGQGHVITQQDE